MQKVLVSVATAAVLATGARAQDAMSASPAPEVLAPEQIAQRHFESGVQFMRDRKYVSAVDAFQRATQLKPDLYEAYNNWGISLVQIGKQSRNPQEQAERFQAAVEKFSKATELKPNDRITYMLWSETLVVLGDLPLEARLRLACYQGAVDKVRKAIQISPDDWEAYNKWAVLLSTKLPPFAVSDQSRLDLFLEASDLFGKAVEHARFSGELGPVYANWGSALKGAARLTTDTAKKQSLLRSALEKFEHSARAIPNASATYAMWGSALIDLGKASRLRGDLREAIDRLNTSLALNPKDAGVLYNLACAYALMDNPVMAVQNLKQCFELDPNKTFRAAAPADPDLASLRGNAEFDELFGLNRGASSVPAYNPPLSDHPR